MTVFETDSRHAFTSGFIALVICLLVASALLGLLFLLPITFVSFLMGAGVLLLLGVALWLGYRLHSLLTTHYAIDQNALVIRHGFTRHIIPMSDIQGLMKGEKIANQIRVRRAPLVGWWIGDAQHPTLGRIHMLATAPMREQLVLQTQHGNFGIAPYDSDLFEETFNSQYALKPSQAVEPEMAQPAWLSLPLWRDRTGLNLLALGLGLNLLLFGISASRYPLAPSQVVLHFNDAGIADRFGAPLQLFTPPAIALLLFILNFCVGLLVYRREERLAGYLVWGGNIVVQLAFLVAVATVAFTSGLTT